MNFLQGHYNRYRSAGGNSGEYYAANDDMSLELFRNLEANYQRSLETRVQEAPKEEEKK